MCHLSSIAFHTVSYRFHNPGDRGYGQSEQIFSLQVDREQF